MSSDIITSKKSKEVFQKLIQFMALMDSFHDFAQGVRVPGGPIDKREIFRLLNGGINYKDIEKLSTGDPRKLQLLNTKIGLTDRKGRLNIDENEYFIKAFRKEKNNSLWVDEKSSTKGLSNRGTDTFEQGITNFLDGKWGDKEEDKLSDEYKIANSLAWNAWNLYSNHEDKYSRKTEKISSAIQQGNYYSEVGTQSYTGNSPKLIIWRKDDMTAFDKIVKEEITNVFGPDRELVFDYSTFNKKITTIFEDNGYKFKVSDATLWDPATRKDATTGDDGEKIYNNNPTNPDNSNKTIFNTLYPYDDIGPDTDNKEHSNLKSQFCTNSTIRLKGINKGIGEGYIYDGNLHPINFKKGRSVSELGKFIRSQMKIRKTARENAIKAYESQWDDIKTTLETLLQKKSQVAGSTQFNKNITDKLEEFLKKKIKNDIKKNKNTYDTVFLDDSNLDENDKNLPFYPDEYNCSALDMKRSGDWGQVAYAKQFGGIFYSGDRMAVMYALIQKCPYIFTGSILDINGVKYSRMIIDPGLFDPVKHINNELTNIIAYFEKEINILTKIYKCFGGKQELFSDIIENFNSIKETITSKIANTLEPSTNITDDDEKKEYSKKRNNYLKKYGGKIIKLFEMKAYTFIFDKYSERKIPKNIISAFSAKLSDESKDKILEYYQIPFSGEQNKFRLGKDNFKKEINDIYDKTIDDNILIGFDNPEQPNLYDNIESRNIKTFYNFTLSSRDELLFDKLKTLIIYLDNIDNSNYNLPKLSSGKFDSAYILITIIKTEYLELLNLLKNTENLSIYELTCAINKLDLIGGDKLGLFSIYDDESNIYKMLQYEILGSQITDKYYNQFVSYYIHKYMFMPIYIIPFILNRNNTGQSILDQIFTVIQRNGKKPPEATKIPLKDISLWQFYFKRNDGDNNNTPFLRLGANVDRSNNNWFGLFNSDSETFNISNNEGGIVQNNQLNLLYTVLSYIVNNSHCDVYDCPKKEDIRVYHKNKDNIYGLNNIGVTLRKIKQNNKKNNAILNRYNTSIKNKLFNKNIVLNSEKISDKVKMQQNINEKVKRIEHFINNQKKSIFNNVDKNIIIPENNVNNTFFNNENGTKIYLLIIKEFLKLLRDAYMLKSENLNEASEEESYDLIVSDDKIKLVKLAIYSLICIMDKKDQSNRYSNDEVLKECKGGIDLIYSIYDSYDSEVKKNNTLIDYKNDKNKMIQKIAWVKNTFEDTIKDIFDKQQKYIINNKPNIDKTIRTIFIKINKKVKFIYNICSKFIFRNYYRNYLLINRSKLEQNRGDISDGIEGKCKYIKDNLVNWDINLDIFDPTLKGSENIGKIVEFCSPQNLFDSNIKLDKKAASLIGLPPGKEEEVKTLEDSKLSEKFKAERNYSGIISNNIPNNQDYIFIKRLDDEYEFGYVFNAGENNFDVIFTDSDALSYNFEKGTNYIPDNNNSNLPEEGSKILYKNNTSAMAKIVEVIRIDIDNQKIYIKYHPYADETEIEFNNTFTYDNKWIEYENNNSNKQNQPPELNQIIDVEYEIDNKQSFWPGKVTKVEENSKSFHLYFLNDNTQFKRTFTYITTNWKEMPQLNSKFQIQTGGYSTTIKKLNKLLLNENYENYIDQIKNTMNSNYSQNELFDKLALITQKCVKDYR